MFTRRYSGRRANVPAPSVRVTGSDDNDRSRYGAPVPPSTEPEQMDVGEAQHSATTYPDKQASHIPQYDRSFTPGSGRSGSTYSESTLRVPSHGALELDKAPLDESTCSAPDNGKNCRPAVPVLESKSEIQDSPLPQSRSTHDEAKPVYLGQKPKNVVLFGETGVGKSSVINLMAGRGIAKTSGNLQGCTLQSTEYWFGLSEEISLRVFDTVGLEEPEVGINSFMGAIEKAHQLVRTLHYSGGIDLLLFCIRGGRITAAMQRSYRLFYEVLCGSKVPLAIIVTNLEQEDVMEDWWVKNEKTFQEYGIRSVAHACITAVPARITAYAQKRAESQTVLRNMLHDTLSKPNPPYVRDIRGWFLAIIQQLRSYLTKTESLKKKELMKKLETRCMLPRNDAEKLAQMLVGDGMVDAALT